MRHLSNGTTVIDPESAARWASVAQPDAACIACRYLPICGGGCALLRLRGAKEETCRDRFGPMDALIRNRWLAETKASTAGG